MQEEEEVSKRKCIHVSFQGGLDDLLSNFHSARIQYGLVGVDTAKGRRVSLAKSYQIIKYPQNLLVIWQGEAPILRKSACAHHTEEVTK